MKNIDITATNITPKAPMSLTECAISTPRINANTIPDKENKTIPTVDAINSFLLVRKNFPFLII